MAIEQAAVRVTRWSGGQHPSRSVISRNMQKEGLRPYEWGNSPNHRYGVRSHGYAKIVYVIEGSVEITLPDSNQMVRLRPGDRIEIPAGIRHGAIVGSSGATCVEAAARR
jgi:quercetin dioxygenase-like cupin family protein